MKKSNIEIEMDESDFVMFKTSCSCSSDSHDLTVIVEKGKDDTLEQAWINLYFKTIWVDHDNGNFFRKIVDRLKAVFKILFTGYLEVDDEFTFRNPEHIKDFRNALEEAIQQVEGTKENQV